MKRGHIRTGRAFGKAVQESSLKDAGVTVFYTDDIDAAIKSCRKGEGLHVVGLRGLASSRKDIENAVAKLHKRGSFAVDVATGRRTDCRDGVALMSEAIKDLANERLGGHAAARADGRKGGLTSGKNRAKRRTPDRDAERIWHDKTLTNAEAVEKINDQGYELDWSLRTLYIHFGKRNVVTGHPAHKK